MVARFYSTFVFYDLQKILDLKCDGRKCYGGERGIRTLGAAINDTHDFQSCSFSQLGHLSVKLDHQTVTIKTKPPPHLWIQMNPLSCGGEGGIRTHDPGVTGYRFSRAGPSATRQPLHTRSLSNTVGIRLITVFADECQWSN
jgi:hypothetical protein